MPDTSTLRESPVLDDAQIRLVQESFAKVESGPADAAAIFYDRLFDIAPDLKPLFKGDMTAQGRKLMTMIKTAVNGLDDVGALIPALEDLGRRHVGYGVKDADYDSMGAALLWTLEQGLGDDFSGETRDAWSTVYALLARIMTGADAKDTVEQGAEETAAGGEAGTGYVAVAKPSAEEPEAATPAAFQAGEATKTREYSVMDDHSTSTAHELEATLAALDKSQATIEFNMDGTIIRANDLYLGAMGYSLDEIQGRHHSMFVEPEFAKSPEYRQFWEALNGGETQAGQYKRLGKGGTDVWIQGSYNPILDVNGKPFKVVTFAADVSGKMKFAAEVQGVTEMVAASATEMQSTAEAMAATAEETNNQAAAVAAASERLTASVNEISSQVSLSASIAGGAVEEAERTNEMVQGLAEAANKIGNVVNLINNIASQTNLLALNATIEAARAGEAGKGFAVVAAEVKNLANQTAKATDDIAVQVNAIQAATQDAVTAIRGIGTTITEISEIATTISSALEEQGAATQEVTSNMSGVTTASGVTGQAAGQVLEAANELAQQGEQLTGKITEFISEDE